VHHVSVAVKGVRHVTAAFTLSCVLHVIFLSIPHSSMSAMGKKKQKSIKKKKKKKSCCP